MAEILILDSIGCHENVEGRITRLMQLYDLRYALENPGRLGVSARSVFFPANLAEVEYFRRQERSAFFKEVRQKLVEAGWWDL